MEEKTMKREMKLKSWLGGKLDVKIDVEKKIKELREQTREANRFRKIFVDVFGHVEAGIMFCDPRSVYIYPLHGAGGFTEEAFYDMEPLVRKFLKLFYEEEIDEKRFHINKPKFSSVSGKFSGSFYYRNVDISLESIKTNCRIEKYEAIIDRYRIVEGTC